MTKLYLYEPTLRPAGIATVPPGWVYVEMPWDLAHMRPDLPRSQYRHGVIGYYNKPLSEQIAKSAALRFLGEDKTTI